MRHSEDKDTKSGRTFKRKRGGRGCKCAKRENAVGANGGWKEAGMERGKARRMERRRMQNGGGRMRNGRTVSSENGGEGGVKMEERTQKCGAAARAGVGHKKWKGPTAVGPFR